jgi:hypothetical protein
LTTVETGRTVALTDDWWDRLKAECWDRFTDDLELKAHARLMTMDQLWAAFLERRMVRLDAIPHFIYVWYGPASLKPIYVGAGFGDCDRQSASWDRGGHHERRGPRAREWLRRLYYRRRQIANEKWREMVQLAEWRFRPRPQMTPGEWSYLENEARPVQVVHTTSYVSEKRPAGTFGMTMLRAYRMERVAIASGRYRLNERAGALDHKIVADGESPRKWKLIPPAVFRGRRIKDNERDAVDRALADWTRASDGTWVEKRLFRAAQRKWFGVEWRR